MHGGRWFESNLRSMGGLTKKLFKGTINNEGIIFVRLKFPIKNIKNIIL